MGLETGRPGEDPNELRRNRAAAPRTQAPRLRWTCAHGHTLTVSFESYGGMTISIIQASIRCPDGCHILAPSQPTETVTSEVSQCS